MRIYVTLLLAVLLASSCAKSWRGDGPPSALEGTVWIGTNQAREEILEFRFGFSGDVSFSGSEDGSSTENGSVSITFASPDDTVYYGGSYSYQLWPSGIPGDVLHAEVFMKLTQRGTGAVQDGWMKYQNQRFYFEFVGGGGAWPTDLAEDSWINSGR